MIIGRRHNGFLGLIGQVSLALRRSPHIIEVCRRPETEEERANCRSFFTTAGGPFASLHVFPIRLPDAKEHCRRGIIASSTSLLIAACVINVDRNKAGPFKKPGSARWRIKDGWREGGRPPPPTSLSFSFLLMCAVLLAMISHKSLYPSFHRRRCSAMLRPRLFWGHLARNRHNTGSMHDWALALGSWSHGSCPPMLNETPRTAVHDKRRLDRGRKVG